MADVVTTGHLPPLVPRNETLITGGIVVVGKWKLATVSLGGYGECGAMGRQGWDCLLGTGGGWVRATLACMKKNCDYFLKWFHTVLG